MTKRSKAHPGVVILKPNEARRIGWRARWTDPDTGKVVRKTLPESVTTPGQREAWAVGKSRELVRNRGGQPDTFVLALSVAELEALVERAVERVLATREQQQETKMGKRTEYAYAMIDGEVRKVPYPERVPKRSLSIGATRHLVTRVTEVDIPKRALYIEELADGTLRITYTRALVPDIALLEQLRIGTPEG